MKGTAFIALSVDGFVSRKDGDISWLRVPTSSRPSDDDGDKNSTTSEEDMGFEAFTDSIDCIIMGRVTFDTVVSFGEDMWAYGDKRIVVWTRNPRQVEQMLPEYLQKTGQVSASSLAPRELFEELANDGHGHAYIDGARTIQDFMKAQLVHPFHLTRIPILLGSGIPLFDAGDVNKDQEPYDHNDIRLKLEDCKSYANGMVSTYYEVIYNGDKGSSD